MSVIAGVVTFGNTRPRPSVSTSIVSEIVAPGNNQVQHFNDACFDMALRHRSKEGSFFSDERFVLVADCHQDVIDQICNKLAIRTPKNTTSGEVLSQAYATWGDSIVDEISGEFAFAIWDKHKRALFCARDRFGRVPFAYALTPNGLVFASDFLPIAACLPVSPKISETWMIEYINGVAADEESTPFEGIKRLPPASVLQWSDGKLEVRKYWSFAEIGPTVEDVDIADIVNALESSIDKRVMGTGVFTMLSGGLDSSSVAILARDQRIKNDEAPLNTLSLIADAATNKTERPFMNAVLSQGGFVPHFVDVSLYDPILELERIVEVQGAPALARGAPIFDQAIAKAQDLGFTTALDGHGGDEISSSFGEMRLFELALDSKWGTLFTELIRTSRNSDLNAMSNFFGMHGLHGRGMTARVSQKIHSILSRSVQSQPSRNLLNEDLREHPAVRQSRSVLNAGNASRFRSERDFHRNMLAAPLQTQALEFIHRQFRSRGLRLELPFWDKDVVEWCVRTPSHHKLKNGVPRSLIRSVMGDRLPTLVANRTTKFDFSDLFLDSMLSAVDRLRMLSAQKNHTVFDFVHHASFVAAIEDLSDSRRDVQLQASSSMWTVLNIFLWIEMISLHQSKRKDPIEIPC